MCAHILGAVGIYFLIMNVSLRTSQYRVAHGEIVIATTIFNYSYNMRTITAIGTSPQGQLWGYINWGEPE